MRFWSSCLCLALLLPAQQSQAQSGISATIELRSKRVVLGDLKLSIPEELEGIDLGSAPPPGGSRLISRAELRRQIKAAGFEHAGLSLPHALRIVSAAEMYSPAALASMVRPRALRLLPQGVTLVKLTTNTRLTLSPDAKVGAIRLPKLPKRIGAVRVSLVAELTLDGEVTHRVPLAAQLNLSAQAASFDVRQGTVVSLRIRRRSALVSARGVALLNADVGEVTRFRIPSTGRVVKAKVTSISSADVVLGQ